MANRADGERTSWPLLHEEMPLSSLQVRGHAMLVRFYNSTRFAQSLSGAYIQTDVWGNATDAIKSIAPRRIETVQLPAMAPQTKAVMGSAQLLTPPPWPVGENAGMPEPAILDELAARIAGLEEEISLLQLSLDGANMAERLRLQHRYYVLKRESVEFQL